MSVQAWFSSEEVALQPGAKVTLPLSIQNLGAHTDSFTVVPAGLTASWTAVGKGNLTLFSGSQDVIPITIAPPVLPTTSAGATVIAVRIIPESAPDDVIVAETTIAIESFDDRRIVPLQPIIRTRRRATYEFMVENHGNGLASCRLRLIDPTERVDGEFDPPAVGIAPGASSLVRLKARAARGVFRRTSRTLDFEVEAEQPGHQPAIGSLAIVQSPTVSGAFLARAGVVIATVAALTGVWFAVARPAIDDAAERRVDERIAELAPEPTTAPTGQPSGTGPVDPPTEDPATPDAIPDFRRLSVSPQLTRTADESFTVPDGIVFDLTDVRIENPFGDEGVATLLLNGDPVFVWSLANIRGSAFEPRITQIRLRPGDNLTFSVRCDAIGDATSASCSTAINVGGLTTPA